MQVICEIWLSFYWNILLSILWEYASISEVNVFVLNKRQAITWTKADQISWRHMESAGQAELVS